MKNGLSLGQRTFHVGVQMPEILSRQWSFFIILKLISFMKPVGLICNFKRIHEGEYHIYKLLFWFLHFYSTEKKI